MQPCIQWQNCLQNSINTNLLSLLFSYSNLFASQAQMHALCLWFFSCILWWQILGANLIDTGLSVQTLQTDQSFFLISLKQYRSKHSSTTRKGLVFPRGYISIIKSHFSYLQKKSTAWKWTKALAKMMTYEDTERCPLMRHAWGGPAKH